MEVNPNDTANRPRSRVSVWLAAIFGIGLVLSIVLNVVLFIMVVAKFSSGGAFQDLHDRRYRERLVGGESSSDNKILIIPVTGVIMSGRDSGGLFGGASDPVQTVRETLKRAEGDEDIKAIILDINSPGGSVTASDNIHRELLRFKAKRPDVIIVSYLGEVAASGGYYVAMPGNRIVAHPTSITGSIGVIASMLNVEGLFQKIGLKSEVIKSADKKDIFSGTRPMTKEERAIMQAMIDEMYQRFVGIVCEGRPNLSRSEVLKLADGRIYTGEQAVKNGLADETGDRDDAFETAKKLAKVSDARLIQYQKRHDFWELFEASALFQPQGIASDIRSALLERNTPHLLYLWQVE
ncbi:MAG: signal peptide peptidase SppA [Planctomycetota bacterium]